MKIERIQHIAIICSDYGTSKQFYTQILGFKIDSESCWLDRNSFKQDLSLNGQYLVELFSFPSLPARQCRPESAGLRHISFALKNIEIEIKYLKPKNILTEPVRLDESTYKRLSFFNYPHNLPIEIQEI